MKPIIALDADGVLLDYHAAYAKAWARAFGAMPALRDPNAYWPLDRWEVRRLAGDELDVFRACFNAEFWATLPPVPGALEACRALFAAGYELVCVSAIKTQFEAARHQNLRDLGFPISRTVAAPQSSLTNAKAEALSTLKPIAFVDDYLPYFRGLSPTIHAALVVREPNGSPNVGEDLALVHSQHANLAAFASWWLGGKGWRASSNEEEDDNGMR